MMIQFYWYDMLYASYHVRNQSEIYAVVFLLMQSKLAASFQNKKVFIVTDLQCLYILSIIRRTLCCGIPLIRQIMHFAVFIFIFSRTSNFKFTGFILQT